MWTGSVARVTALAFAPDGRALYVGDNRGRVTAWDTAAHTGTWLYDVPPDTSGGWPIPPTVNRLFPDPAARELLVWGRGRLAAIDLDRPGRFESFFIQPIAHHPDLAPDGRLLADAGEGRVRFWEPRSRRPLPVPARLAALTGVTFLRFAAGGELLLVFTDHVPSQVHVWDLGDGRFVGRLEPCPTFIWPSALSADGGTLAIHVDRVVRLYDVRERTVRGEFQLPRPAHELAFHPDGRVLAAAGARKGVTLWDAASGAARGTFDWGIGRPSCLAFAPDGLTAAAGGTHGFAVWDVDLD